MAERTVAILTDTAPFGHQAAQPGFPTDRIGVDQPKQPHRRPDVQPRAVVGDPPCGRPRPRRPVGRCVPTPEPAPAGCGHDTQLVERLDRTRVGADRGTRRPGESVPPQGHQRVDGQLAGAVQQAPAAPIDPLDLDLAGFRTSRLSLADLGRRGRPGRSSRPRGARRATGRSARRRRPGDLADQPPLQLQAPRDRRPGREDTVSSGTRQPLFGFKRHAGHGTT